MVQTFIWGFCGSYVPDNENVQILRKRRVKMTKDIVERAQTIYESRTIGIGDNTGHFPLCRETSYGDLLIREKLRTSRMATGIRLVWRGYLRSVQVGSIELD